MRVRCQERGHRFRQIEGVFLPVLFCSRWRCDASQADAYADSMLQGKLSEVCDG